MATKTVFYNTGGTPSNGQVLGVKSATVDFAVDAGAIADEYKLFDLGTNEVVVEAGYTVLTAGPEVATFSIGVSGAKTSIEATANLDTLATVRADALPAARAADTLYLTLAAALATTGKVQVWAVIAFVEDPAY